MGAWWAWIWLCYNSTQLFALLPEETQALSVRLMYLASTAGIAFMTLLGGLFWRHATELVRNDRFVLIMGLGAGVSSALLCPATLAVGVWIGPILALLTGVFTSALCLKCGYLYGQMGLGYTLTAGCIALAFAALLFFAGMALDGITAIIYVSCLPVLSAALMSLRDEDPLDVSFLPDNASSPNKEARKVFVRLVVASCLIALVAGISRGVSTSVLPADEFASVGEIIVACIGLIGAGMAVWINRRGANKALKGSYTALMMFAVVIALLSNFDTIITLLSISKEPLWMVFSCLLAYMAFRFDFSPVRTFGIAQSTYFVSSLVGWGIGGVLGDHTTDALKLSVSIFLCIVLLFVFVFVFRTTDIDFIVRHKRGRGHRNIVATVGARSEGAIPSEASATLINNNASLKAGAAKGEGVGPSDSDASDSQAGYRRYTDDELESQFALSQREIEIARMFAQGRSANWIADELTISKNTVRSHLRSAYVKLGVHTRQELIDALG